MDCATYKNPPKIVKSHLYASICRIFSIQKALQMHPFGRKNLYWRPIARLMTACFLLLAVSLPATAQTTNEQLPENTIMQSQPGSDPVQNGEGESAEGAEAEGAADATGIDAVLGPRTAVGEEPVASDDWAKAHFTGFIDISQRLREPDEELLSEGLRLLTAPGFPPFNYRDKSGAPIGYHVELARAFCDQLNIACTVKIVPFARIAGLLAANEADAALAGLVRHPDLKGKVAFSNVFLKRPGRFLHLKDQPLRTDIKSMEGKPVAVIGGSAHEAFLRAYFDGVNRVPVNDLHAARDLLEEGKVVAVFGDAFQLLPFAAERNSIFSFAGKPYYDDYFFGDGMTFAFPAGREQLGNLLNYGLQKLAQSGRMAELYARHFALDVYADY